VNLRDRVVEVYREPIRGTRRARYASTHIATANARPARAPAPASRSTRYY